MADYTPGSDDMLAMREEALADEAQERYHSGHLSPLENPECYDCARDLVNYPSEFLVGDDELFWATIDLCELDPSDFEFVFQPQLKALGLA